MSEHIYEDSDMEHEYYHVIPFGSMHEEIVRCRDCEHYRKHKWFEVVVGTPLGTDISDVCMLFADGCKVEPDGFCAWGVRKAGDAE